MYVTIPPPWLVLSCLFIRKPGTANEPGLAALSSLVSVSVMMSYLEINPVASLHFALNPFKFHVASHTTPVFFLPRSTVLMAEFGDLVFSPVVVPFLCFWIIGVVFITVFSVPALFLWVTALFAFALVEGFTTFGSGVTMFVWYSGWSRLYQQSAPP